MRLKYEVWLEAIPNPDFPAASDLGSVRVPGYYVKVIDLETAARALREFIVKHQLGSGNIAPGCGKVYDEWKNLIARVCFNGRARLERDVTNVGRAGSLVSFKEERDPDDYHVDQEADMERADYLR